MHIALIPHISDLHFIQISQQKVTCEEENIHNSNINPPYLKQIKNGGGGDGGNGGGE